MKNERMLKPMWKWLIIPVVMLMLLGACKNDEDPDFSNKGVFKVKIDGVVWEPDQVTFFRGANNSFQINGVNTSNKSQLGFAIEPDEPGDYLVQDENVYFDYSVVGDDIPAGHEDVTVYIDHISEGSINITKFTQDSIKFTFSGKGESFEYTEGEVAIKIN